MHINCPRILAFFWGEKTFRLNKPTASSVAFSLCGFQASKLSGIKDHFSDASWSPSSLGWWFLWVWDFFVGETLKWNMTARSGRGLVGSFVAWLFWLVGSSTTSTTTKKEKQSRTKKNDIWCFEHKLWMVTAFTFANMLLTWYRWWYEGGAVHKLWSYSTCSPIKILIDSTRGAPNSTGWAPTIVVNGVTWGP